MIARSELLLNLCLCDSPEAVRDLWTVWRTQTGGLEHLAPLEHRLLPFVWRQLDTHRVIDTNHLRLRGLYKKSWYYNHHLLSVAAGLQQNLSDQGIPSVLFKGCAMMLAAYPEIALRKTTDIDLYVQPKDFPLAKRLMQTQFAIQTKSDHAIHFAAVGQRGVDLHWASSTWNRIVCDETINKTFVDAAQPVHWQGHTLTLPSPTDLLFHSLLNVFSHHTPYVNHHQYWVLDAHGLSNNQALDLDQLVAMIRRLGCGPLWKLHFDRVDAALPARLEEIHRQLADMSWTFKERRLETALIELKDRPLRAAPTVTQWQLVLHGVSDRDWLRAFPIKSRVFWKVVRQAIKGLEFRALTPSVLGRKFKTLSLMMYELLKR